MSSIFANPISDNESEGYFGQKVLFLHGLEGSPSGAKATYLKERWGALCPPLRTEDIRNLNAKKGTMPWSNISPAEVEKALEPVVADALDAVNYCTPDIIVGSSMGGAILAKMIIDNSIDTSNHSIVFLAPAINELVQQPNKLPKIPNSVWVLGETDVVVDNGKNVQLCKSSHGNLIFSPGDDHRLSKALQAGLIDAAILTSLELRLREF